MPKIALIGAGHLGKIHLRCLQTLPQWELVGFYDTDPTNAQKVSEQFAVPFFEDIDALLTQVDALDIVTPTSTHFDWAQRGINQGKHLFIEKPVTHSLQEVKALRELSLAHPSLKIQIGHVERFNPAVLALQGQMLQPKFIEAHRLSMFNPRGTDVSVVFDLMIHDLDMLLKWVNSPVRAVYANGVALVSSSPDIANARIEFENGAVANLTASRISLKQMRKFRIFQPDAYISIDLLNKKTEIVRLHQQPDNNHHIELDTALGKRYIEIAMPEVPEINAIQTELSSFEHAISQNVTPQVTLNEGLKAVELAHQISDVINLYNQNYGIIEKFNFDV